MDAGIAQSVEQLIRNQQVVSSSLISSSKKKGLPIGSPFFLGSSRQRRLPPFGLKCSAEINSACAEVLPTAKHRTAHKRRRPEGRLGGIYCNRSKTENINFNRPFQKRKTRFQRVFLFWFRGPVPAPPSRASPFQRRPALLGGILHRRRGFLFSWRKNPNPLSLLPEVGQAQVGGRLILTLLAEADQDQHGDGDQKLRVRLGM